MSHPVLIVFGLQKLLPIVEEQPSAEGRLSELDGMLSAEEKQYFQALKLISALRAMPGFNHLPTESLGYDNPISQPPPLMYI